MKKQKLIREFNRLEEHAEHLNRMREKLVSQWHASVQSANELRKENIRLSQQIANGNPWARDLDAKYTGLQKELVATREAIARQVDEKSRLLEEISSLRTRLQRQMKDNRELDSTRLKAHIDLAVAINKLRRSKLVLDWLLHGAGEEALRTLRVAEHADRLAKFKSRLQKMTGAANDNDRSNTVDDGEDEQAEQEPEEVKLSWRIFRFTDTEGWTAPDAEKLTLTEEEMKALGI